MTILKARFGTDIRRRSIPNAHDRKLDDLILMVQCLFLISNNDDIQLKYRDSDGDFITIGDDTDFQLALQEPSLFIDVCLSESRNVPPSSVSVEEKNEKPATVQPSPHKEVNSLSADATAPLKQEIPLEAPHVQFGAPPTTSFPQFSASNAPQQDYHSQIPHSTSPEPPSQSALPGVQNFILPRWETPVGPPMGGVADGNPVAPLPQSMYGGYTYPFPKTN